MRLLQPTHKPVKGAAARQPLCTSHPESWAWAGFYATLGPPIRYVMAHEMAHAIGHFYGHPRWADDHWADAVAHAFGAPVCAHSPYCRHGPHYPKFRQQAPPDVLVVPPLAPVRD